MSSLASSTETKAPAASLRCDRCGAGFTCEPEGECWCMALPPLPMPEQATSCLCPGCLKQEIAARRTC